MGARVFECCCHCFLFLDVLAVRREFCCRSTCCPTAPSAISKFAALSFFPGSRPLSQRRGLAYLCNYYKPTGGGGHPSKGGMTGGSPLRTSCRPWLLPERPRRPASCSRHMLCSRAVHSASTNKCPRAVEEHELAST